MLEAEVAKKAYLKRCTHLRCVEYEHINSLLKLYDSGVINAEQFVKKTMDVMWSDNSALGVEGQKKTLDGLKLRDFIFSKELGEKSD